MATDRTRPPRRGRWAALAVLLPLLAGVLGVVRHLPPAPLADDAAFDRFSAGRALHDIGIIARAPHPIGSAEHRRVRAYVVDRLESLGFETEVQQGLGLDRKHGVAAPVANIVARRKGQGGDGKAIMLVAHYDSVPTGPGASDDAAGVAALLEAGRWLGTQPALRNDVILLVSDGEEFGLLGAEAFVAGHRWARSVGLVVNLEARGHTGPSILFETSAHNAALIRGAGRGVPSIVANSLAYEVYKRLPNDTDFTVFRRAGMAGVNLAYLGGVTHYHSALDTPANVDRASLQHHGEYLTGVLREFGNAALPLPDEGDAVYFEAPWGGIAAYPPWLALPLAALGLVLAGVLLVRARRGGGLGAAQFARSLLRALALPAGAAAAGWLFWAGLRQVNPAYRWLSNGDGYHADLVLYGFLVLIAAAVIDLAGRRPADRAACWLVWALLALATAVHLPGASWLFAWPLLAGALAELAGGRVRAKGRPERESALRAAALRDAPPRATATAALALGLVPLAFLALPMLWLLSTAMGPAMLPVVAAFAALCLLPMAPLLATLRGGALRSMLALAGLGLIGTGLALGGFDANQKKPNHVIYLLERASATFPAARSRWITADAQTDAWTAQFLGVLPAPAPVPELGRDRPLLQSGAPLLDLPAPRTRVTADDVADGLRRVTLHVDSPADLLVLQADGDSAVRAVLLDGRPLFDAADGQPFRRVAVVAPPSPGADFRFELPAGAPLRLQIVQQFRGLPDRDAAPHAPRAADMMTTPMRQADSRFSVDRWAD